MCGREGRKEREWKAGKAGLVALPSLQLARQSRGRWRHTLTPTSTDRHTCTPRPPGGLAQPVPWGVELAAAHLPCVAPPTPGGWHRGQQPRSPRPGRTTSRAECVEPAG